jgi:hypothetical protein
VKFNIIAAAIAISLVPRAAAHARSPYEQQQLDLQRQAVQETFMSMEQKFDLGRVVTTPGALKKCGAAHIAVCMARHAFGDWGVVDAEDKATNDRALVNGERLLSAYAIDPKKPCKGHGENCLWIITEWDRSVTTALLPDEY